MANSARSERMEFRTTTTVKALVERAAVARGISKTEYLSELIERDATEVLKRQQEVTLTNAQFDNFMVVCQDESLIPSSRILEAARRLDKEGF